MDQGEAPNEATQQPDAGATETEPEKVQGHFMPAVCSHDPCVFDN